MLPPDLCWLCQDRDGTIRTDGPLPVAILSGSFNPVHRGHRALAGVAEARLGQTVAYELSIVNVDKPEIPIATVKERLQQFAGLAPVYVTRAMTFEQKARLFRGAVLVVGADTAVRILDPRYYRNDAKQRDESLQRIREFGCRFLVGGRRHPDGSFVALEGIDVPRSFSDLFEGVPESIFREDISSTQLRQSGG